MKRKINLRESEMGERIYANRRENLALMIIDELLMKKTKKSLITRVIFRLILKAFLLVEGRKKNFGGNVFEGKQKSEDSSILRVCKFKRKMV